MHKLDDLTNKYYEQRDINQDYNFYGVYYADCTSTFGEELGVNTCIYGIYGHTISDDPESERYDIKFGRLLLPVPAGAFRRLRAPRLSRP